MSARGPEVVVVGAGPNGLTAAACLARAGFGVEVYEAGDAPGGGCRSAALTLPGFTHDVCAAVHPMGALSPVFRELELQHHGVEWLRSPRALAHPLPDGTAATLDESLAATADGLGRDGPAWRSLFAPFANAAFIDSLLQPLWYGGGHLMTKARFGLLALRSAEAVARARFARTPAQALFLGCAGHAVLPLERAGTAAFGLMLAASAHAVGWPIARGGSQAITAALVQVLRAHGGAIRLGCRINGLGELPPARAILFDLSPRQVAQIAGDALPARFRAAYARYPHGPGVFKVDWALRDPIPWRAAACRQATTVHVCGGVDEVLRSEDSLRRNRAPDRPFVLVAQPSLVDPSRAPAGRHTAWAYCHVPNGCPDDMTERIEAQVERFAPGFRDTILARHTRSAVELEHHNPAMIGGDMAGGRNSLLNFLFRPVPRWTPYATPNPRLFVCSSATPPGGGVHGMCGYHAAQAVLQSLRRR